MDEKDLQELCGLTFEDLQNIDMGSDEEEPPKVPQKSENAPRETGRLPVPAPTSDSNGSITTTLGVRTMLPVPPPSSSLQGESPDEGEREEIVLIAQHDRLPEEAFPPGQLRELYVLERAVIETTAKVAASAVTALGGAGREAEEACRAAQLVVEGNYAQAVAESSSWLRTTAGAAVTSATASGAAPRDVDVDSSALMMLRAIIVDFVVGASLQQQEAAAAPTIAAAEAVPDTAWRAARAMWTGAAFLNLFVQLNYTGPELQPAAVAEMQRRLGALLSIPVPAAQPPDQPVPKRSGVEQSGTGVESDVSSSGGDGPAVEQLTAAANAALAADGELPYPHSHLPAALLMARVILSTLADPTHALWTTPAGADADADADAAEKRAASLAAATATASAAAASTEAAKAATATALQRRPAPGNAAPSPFLAAAGLLTTALWWSGRAAVAHARLLLSRDRPETLRLEAADAWRDAVARFGGSPGPRAYTSARVWLEWGLAQHHYRDASMGKHSFRRAQRASGLVAELTGALGRRTKFQQNDLAQLVLVASSAEIGEDRGGAGGSNSVCGAMTVGDRGIVAGGNGPAANDLAAAVVAALPGASSASAPAVQTADGMEMGRSLARPVNAAGDEAVARVIGHAAGSHLLDEGIVFATTNNGAAGAGAGGGTGSADDKRQAAVAAAVVAPTALRPVDAAIVLALCLDVENSNPRDGLTNEEMSPYLERVLALPGGGNWMVYSAALLQRAWVEFARSHKRERAALQLQALLDQHTTRLTYTQASFAAVADAAPAAERLAFVHALAYPPRWELKRDLATRYAQLGVLISAAQLFESLEMWDEVVECYHQAQQVGRAEAVVRGRLARAETPQMWAALGDLTQDAACYERAWELSGGRLARAQTALGRLRFAEGRHGAARAHLERSVGVKPLQVGAWFTLGACCMRLEDWPAALAAFTRAVQLDPEQGEAWGNIGAIRLRRGEWAAAAAALAEGLKQKRESWRMWENHLTALLRLGRWGEAMYDLHRLLDLRERTQRPVDAEALEVLVDAVPPLAAAVAAASDAAAAEAAKAGTVAAAVPPAEAVPESAAPDMAAIEEATEAAMSDATAAAAAAAAGGAASGTATTSASLMQHPLMKQLAELLGRVTGTVRGDARLWELYALFDQRAGRGPAAVLSHRSKQCRALMAAAGWEKDPAAVAAVADCSEHMVDLWRTSASSSGGGGGGGSGAGSYEARMHLRACVRRVEVAEVAADCEGVVKMRRLLEGVQ